MCEWGNSTDCWILVPSELSHKGWLYWKKVGIDSCIAPLVDALNRAKIWTASSCCGHGKQLGHIWLHDGRILIIMPDDTTKEQLLEKLEI